MAITDGLVLPPAIAPVQVVVLPIAQHKEGVLEAARAVTERLRGVCRVKIAEVDGNDPLFKVKNGENALAFYSHYYQPLPLVLRGYGAGNDVTAAGVFADLLRTLSWKLGV